MSSTDPYGRIIYNESDVINLLYINPELDVSKLLVSDVGEYNSSIDALYSELDKISIPIYDGDPAQFHQQNQQNWHMPEEYKQLDIAQWLLEQCSCDAELQRVGQELLMFQERNLFGLLQFLKYFIDTCKENNIVLGVGRGSSVASYVLYLIGVHRVNSMYYNLDIQEFLR